MIGFGCDGASVNIAAGGLRGLLEKSVPWVAVFWCLAHRLELSLKDALKNTFFSSIDEMLLRVYYLYQKSAKKCRELEEVVEELKSCLEPTEMPDKGGNRPLHACGTRFVTHKVAALGRLIDRYGAYVNHLTALTEDSTVKACDKQRLKGYILKWRTGKMLQGSALFHDLLRPCAIPCKVLQDDEVCIVSAIEVVLKTNKAIERFNTTAFDDLPTVKKVFARIEHKDGVASYQGADLADYESGKAYLKSHKDQYTDKVVSCLKDRVKVHHPDLLTDTLTILATQGWQKVDVTDSSVKLALQRLSSRFEVPLQKAQVDIALLEEEWEDMTEYAKRYLDLVQEDYRTIWWKLFNSVDSKKWTNILSLAELLFCLPMANGHVERLFSSLKLIKTDRRSCLGEDHLDHLVRISADGPPLAEWDETAAVQLWWKSKTRRQVGDTRAPPKQQPSSSKDDSMETDIEPYAFSLDDWESFIA